MGTVQGAGPGVTGTGPRFTGAWGHRPIGMLHRRHLRGGEKRGCCVGKTKRGKGTKIMVIADRAGLPLSIHIESASPHEVTLVEATLQARFTEDAPQKLIGDRAYDSDPLDQALKEQGIQMIAPHRRNRKKPKTQDGRPLRRYKRRWKVERLIGWLQNFRRVVVRYERHSANYLGFVQMACIRILLRAYL
jgi:transposase